jgi:hypothetical protein
MKTGLSTRSITDTILFHRSISIATQETFGGVNDETLPRVPQRDIRAGPELPAVRGALSGAGKMGRLGLRV